MTEPVKPCFDLPAVEPTYQIADEWLIHWTKTAWMYPKSASTPKAHDLSMALLYVLDPLQRIRLITVFTTINGRSILEVYDGLPKIKEIDDYLDDRLTNLGYHHYGVGSST